MTKTDVAVLGCRLISIYVCFSATTKTMMEASYSADWLHGIYGNQPITWAYLGLLLPGILRIALAGLLWFVAPGLWRLTARDKSGDDTSTWTAVQLLRMAFFLCGTTMLLNYLALIGGRVFLLQPLPAGEQWLRIAGLLGTYKDPRLLWLTAILPVALSACLIYFSRPVAGLIFDPNRRAQ